MKEARQLACYWRRAARGNAMKQKAGRSPVTGGWQKVVGHGPPRGVLLAVAALSVQEHNVSICDAAQLHVRLPPASSHMLDYAA